MKATSSKFAVWIIPIVLAMGWPMPLDGDEVSTSVQDGVYNKAQASRGRKQYQELCRTCHEGDDFATGYLDAWTGRTAFDFVELLLNTMPEEDPGVGGAETFADIVAYIFRLNGLPAGEAEMKSDEESLKLILIEGPYGANDGP